MRAAQAALDHSTVTALASTVPLAESSAAIAIEGTAASAYDARSLALVLDSANNILRASLAAARSSPLPSLPVLNPFAAHLDREQASDSRVLCGGHLSLPVGLAGSCVAVEDAIIGTAVAYSLCSATYWAKMLDCATLASSRQHGGVGGKSSGPYVAQFDRATEVRGCDVSSTVDDQSGLTEATEAAIPSPALAASSIQLPTSPAPMQASAAQIEVAIPVLAASRGFEVNGTTGDGEENDDCEHGEGYDGEDEEEDDGIDEDDNDDNDDDDRDDDDDDRGGDVSAEPATSSNHAQEAISIPTASVVTDGAQSTNAAVALAAAAAAAAAAVAVAPTSIARFFSWNQQQLHQPSGSETETPPQTVVAGAAAIDRQPGLASDTHSSALT